MFEIRTALYAMMVVSGQYSSEEIKARYADTFKDDGIHIDTGYMEDLIEIMSKHWIDKKIANLKVLGKQENITKFRNSYWMLSKTVKSRE